MTALSRWQNSYRKSYASDLALLRISKDACLLPGTTNSVTQNMTPLLWHQGHRLVVLEQDRLLLVDVELALMTPRTVEAQAPVEPGLLRSTSSWGGFATVEFPTGEIVKVGGPHPRGIQARRCLLDTVGRSQH